MFQCGSSDLRAASATSLSINPAALCGLTLSSLLQDAEDRVVGGGSADVLQDLVHSGGVRTAGQDHPLLVFRANVHGAAEEASPPEPEHTAKNKQTNKQNNKQE